MQLNDCVPFSALISYQTAKNRTNGNGERERILIRCSEALTNEQREAVGVWKGFKGAPFGTDDVCKHR